MENIKLQLFKFKNNLLSCEDCDKLYDKVKQENSFFEIVKFVYIVNIN